MKKLICVFLSAMLILGLVACGGPAENESKDPQANSGSGNGDAVRVCIVYSGSLGDKSYNDSCNEGAQRAAKELGVEVKNLEASADAAEWKANLLSAAEDGYDLVICSSSNFEEYLKEIGPKYPDVKFAIIDTTVAGDNIVSVSFAQNQGSFLAGAAAAMFTTKTDIDGVNEDKVIGWVGGMDIPVLHDFYVGYEQGAKYIDPDIKILQSFAGAWNDPLKGKELTLAQFDQGADIVMNVASGTGPGILEGAAEAGKYAIGVDLDQDDYQPGHVLTSQLKRVDTACYMLIKSVVDGTFKGNTVSYLDIASEGVSLTDFSVMREALGDKFPEDIVEKINELEQKIASGEIVVENYDGFGPSAS